MIGSLIRRCGMSTFRSALDIVLVDGDPNPTRPDLPPYEAGEAALKPTLVAVGNAIYDAAGVRIRRVPFRAERALAALKTTGTSAA